MLRQILRHDQHLVMGTAGLLLLLTACSPSTTPQLTPAAVVTTTQAPKTPLQLRLSPEQVNQMHLTTALVTRRPLSLQVQTSGQVQIAADRMTEVTAPVTGRVEQVLVSLGTRVQTGQLLAKLRSDEAAQLESDLLQRGMDLEADRAQAQVQVTLSRGSFLREQQLFQEKVGAKADLEAARGEYQKAQASLQSLQAKRQALLTTAAERLRLLGLPSGEAQRVLRERRVANLIPVRAPRSGIVTARNINPGELIDNTKPLFTLADLSQVWVVAQVFEQNIALVRPGLAVAVRVDSYPGQIFTGRLDYVAPSLEAATRTLPVRATVANPQGRLRPQMFARLTLQAGSLTVLAVPSGAVQKSGETYVAYVPSADHTYQERRLRLGRTLDAYTEVISGLQPGEAVVVQGSLQLQGQALQLASQ